jgi:hypothetical protein
MRIDGISSIMPRHIMPAIDAAVPLANIAAKTFQEASKAGNSSTPAIEQQAQPQVAATPQAMGSVQMLVAVSSVTPAEEKRKVQVALARKGLDALDRLHREMLSGKASKSTLESLKQWLDDMPDPDDEKMNKFFKDIELRVRVEMAKFDLEA